MYDYDTLAREALAGGFTVDRDGQPITTGYAVSTRKDAERSIAVGPGIADAIYSYVVHYGRDLRKGCALGAWRDEDRIVLDLVQVTPSRLLAMVYARTSKQEAIYHLDTGTVLHTSALAREYRERGLDDAEDAGDDA